MRKIKHGMVLTIGLAFCVVSFIIASLVWVVSVRAQENQTFPRGAEYIVAGVQTGDYLNVRDKPAAASATLMTLPPNTSGLFATGRTARYGNDLWVEVTVKTITGWVNSKFIQVIQSADRVETQTTQRFFNGAELIVTGVQPGDVLNVRDKPSATSTVLLALSPNTSGFFETGRTAHQGNDLWLEVTAKATTGWINSKFVQVIQSSESSKKPTPSKANSQGARIALVIGTSKYLYVDQLKNPKNDSIAIAKALKNVGFDEVITLEDPSHQDLLKAFSDFAQRARNASFSLVYFSGHGIEINGSNYLIPIDARLEYADAALTETVSLTSVLNQLSTVPGLKVLVLDSCRANPFQERLERTEATRELKLGANHNLIGRGMGRASVETKEHNILVAYAAKDGSFALDGEGNYSPFATAFLHNIETPGLEVGLFFRRVRDEVWEATSQKQEPFTYGSLGGQEFFLNPLSGGIELPQWDSGTKDAYLKTLILRTDPIVQSIKDLNFKRLSNFVHPAKGLRVGISPYIDKEIVTIDHKDIATDGFSSRIYKWPSGYSDTNPITPISKYFSEVIYKKDYILAPQHSFGKPTNGAGSEIDTIFEAFPGAIFVDYHYPSTQNALDWGTLRLVFQELQGRWYLVAVLEFGWTP